MIVFDEHDYTEKNELLINQFYKVEYFDNLTCCGRIPKHQTCLDKQKVLSLLHKKESDYDYTLNDKSLDSISNSNYSIVFRWIKQKIGFKQ